VLFLDAELIYGDDASLAHRTLIDFLLSEGPLDTSHCAVTDRDIMVSQFLKRVVTSPM